MRKHGSILHCGACGEEFPMMFLLKEHMEKCIYRKIFLIPNILQMFGGETKPGHHISCVIYLAKKHKKQIEEYVNIVIESMNNPLKQFNRVEKHIALCELLQVDYKKFKPFESSLIRRIPTFEEGLEHFLRLYANEFGAEFILGPPVLWENEVKKCS